MWLLDKRELFSYCKKDYHLGVVKACLVFIRYQISEPMNTFESERYRRSSKAWQLPAVDCIRCQQIVRQVDINGGLVEVCINFIHFLQKVIFETEKAGLKLFNP